MFSLKIFSRTAFQKYQDPNHHLINSTLHFPTHNLSNWQSQFLCTPKFHKNLKGKRPRAIFCHMLLCYSPTLIPLCDCFSLTKWLHCSHWWFCQSRDPSELYFPFRKGNLNALELTICFGHLVEKKFFKFLLMATFC